MMTQWGFSSHQLSLMGIQGNAAINRRRSSLIVQMNHGHCSLQACNFTFDYNVIAEEYYNGAIKTSRYAPNVGDAKQSKVCPSAVWTVVGARRKFSWWRKIFYRPS